jgi:hypothetical protein
MPRLWTTWQFSKAPGFVWFGDSDAAGEESNAI